MSAPLAPQLRGTALLKRLPLLFVAALMMWLFGWDRPRSVDVSYTLPPGTTYAVVSLSHPTTGEFEAALSWGDGVRPARSPQSHKPFLRPGPYRVEARLQDAAGREQLRSRMLEVRDGEETIIVHLEPP